MFIDMLIVTALLAVILRAIHLIVVDSITVMIFALKGGAPWTTK